MKKWRRWAYAENWWGWIRSSQDWCS